jgi:hypothetical protein
VLAKSMALFRTDEFLEDEANHVGGHVAEINGLDTSQKSEPRIHGAIWGKNLIICPVVLLREQQGLVVAAFLIGFGEYLIDSPDRLSGRLDAIDPALRECYAAA